MRKIAYFLIVAALLAGCKSSRRLERTMEAPEAAAPRYLASRVELTLPAGGGSLSVGGILKMKRDERIQISLLMPILRTEVARLEITPADILVVDRMNKRFVRATREELQAVLPGKASFARLEKLLTDASRPGGKTEISGKELGLPKLEGARARFYEFSTGQFPITPTELTSRYRQVSLEELMRTLIAL